MKIINSFPGYEFKHIEGDAKPHNIYRDTDMGFGGYIRSWPGMYTNVALLDVASLHPSSIRAMNCFGEYTKNFTDILDARIAIKHGDFETARKMLDGKLAPYLNDESQAKNLAQALKIAINSVYGLTAASFSNPFQDPRNKNNIVALRGALFMKTLQDEVEKRGYKIVAVKTDSIKIADATPEIIDFCMEFGKKYAYTFEFEAHYDRICQINDADYIARYSSHEVNGKHAGEWTATGKQFQIPYIFKTLFSKEPVEFKDLCETKEVKTALYLDMNESNPDEHNYVFIGKVGLFSPIKPGHGGGELMRQSVDKEGNVKYSSATGAKGYRWLESEMVRTLEMEDAIDRSYYDAMVDTAVDAISKYCDFEWFISEDEIITDEQVPWGLPCGNTEKPSCRGCEHFTNNRYHIDCDLGYDISNTFN